MRIGFRGVSGAALLIGLAGGLQSAWAQQSQTVTTTQPPATTSTATTGTDQITPKAEEATDRVVVIGSVTRNREAGELAVEVYTADDFKKAGNPNIVEFVQSLSVVGDSVGNMDPTLASNGGAYTDLYGPGFANVNLRGLSDADSERTLNLLNGRRTDPNANMIPMQALAQIEILKDGASATYGAGAIGGVVNFITRRDFEGLIIEGEYKYIETAPDSPQYELKYTQGWAGESSNLLLTAAYSHQEPIMGSDLEWARNPYSVNPRQWSGIYSNANPTVWYNNATVAQSIPDFTTASCTALGGVNPRTGAAGHPQSPAGVDEGSICLLDNVPFLSVVQELSTYRGYAQYDSDLDETMKFHAELSYTKTDAPNIRQPASGAPDAASAAMEAGGTNYPAACSSTLGRCGYSVPYNHPAFADFLARANVGRASQLVTGTAGAGQTSIGTGPLWGGYWRPFGYGGRYEGEPWTIGSRKEDNWRGTLQLAGEFSDGGMFGLGRFLPAGTSYDFAISGASRKGRVTNPDVVSYRLQEALNGFGGPNCHAVDNTPTVLPGHGAPFTAAEITAFNNSIGTQNASAAGKNGCLWFNPFASAYPSNAATGASNPSYNSALANDPELVKWLFTDGATQSRYQEINMDFHIGGDLEGIEAPGGKINWGVGGQWRQWEWENRGLDPYMTPRYYDCPWDPWIPPGQMRQSVGGIGCDRTTSSGAGVGALMSRSVRPTRITDRQTIAGFGELHVPILDNLSVSGTARYEEISGSIGDWVYSASFKWDILDWVALRGNYSDNFASPNPDVLDNDGQIEVGVVGGAGGPSVPVTTIVDPNLEVERTKQFSIGFIFKQNDFLMQDARLRANIDYFNYFIEGEVSTLGGSTIVSRAFPAVGTGTGAIVDTGQPRVVGSCANTLFNFITLDTPCVDAVIVNRIVQNPTTATTISNVTAVNSLVVNGPGIKQAGVDFTLDYTFPFFDGQLGIGTRGTRILEYKSKAAFYNGIQIPLSLQAGFGGTEDYLGYSNIAQFYGTGKQGARWRASVYANYGTDDMNFRWTTRLVSAVDDERGCFTYSGNGSLSGGGTTCFGVDGEDHYVSDFNWTWDTPFIDDFQIRFSVLNVFDKDPAPLSGGEGTGAVYFPSLPYNAYVSNPLGRQFEIGFAKTF